MTLREELGLPERLPNGVLATYWTDTSYTTAERLRFLVEQLRPNTTLPTGFESAWLGFLSTYTGSWWAVRDVIAGQALDPLNPAAPRGVYNVFGPAADNAIAATRALHSAEALANWEAEQERLEQIREQEARRDAWNAEQLLISLANAARLEAEAKAVDEAIAARDVETLRRLRPGAPQLLQWEQEALFAADAARKAEYEAEAERIRLRLAEEEAANLAERERILAAEAHRGIIRNEAGEVLLDPDTGWGAGLGYGADYDIAPETPGVQSLFGEEGTLGTVREVIEEKRAEREEAGLPEVFQPVAVGETAKAEADEGAGILVTVGTLLLLLI